jgi:serine/threonine protein kinase
VIHRDLKPGNLLVNKNCDLKVCDFGLARSVLAANANTGPVGPLTEYVVTRWYRAPELLVEAELYDTAIDVWAIGCIFAEMLGRKALFPGRDYLDQLKRIIAVVGTPSEEDLRAITNPEAVDYIRKIERQPKKSWGIIYPKASADAHDLLDKMLAFNPKKRISVEDALHHPYVAGLLKGSREPPPTKQFSFAFDQPFITQQQLRDQIWAEMRAFHPEADQLPDTHKDDD